MEMLVSRHHRLWEEACVNPFRLECANLSRHMTVEACRQEPFSPPDIGIQFVVQGLLWLDVFQKVQSRVNEYLPRIARRKD
jgi:hypothetical protein